jgi:hypothetical protein
MFEPILLNEMVGKLAVATKEYHTSAPGEPQVLATAGLETVAPARVPPVLTQEEPGVNDVADEQLSLAGGEARVGSTIHKLNVVVEPLFVVTLT